MGSGILALPQGFKGLSLIPSPGYQFPTCTNLGWVLRTHCLLPSARFRMGAPRSQLWALVLRVVTFAWVEDAEGWLLSVSPIPT